MILYIVYQTQITSISVKSESNIPNFPYMCHFNKMLKVKFREYASGISNIIIFKINLIFYQIKRRISTEKTHMKRRYFLIKENSSLLLKYKYALLKKNVYLHGT